MRGRKRHARAAEPLPLDLCDLCGVTLPPERTVSTYVPDSSAALPGRDAYDGLRLLTACCEQHLTALREQYRARPFVQEELWAAKIERELNAGTPVLTMTQLGCRTGLHEPEIRRAIAWHNAHLPPRP
ncbi:MULTISPECIES: hypothetical protein [Streptomyces]|jgi:hypothetical protein|uniref:HNH endonuclease n=1 Tax=Streptomyces thermoviolaceus subsp. thermoviolaceus TaxID=66860 RepID=A0ABX0YUF5_STRTL|nr:MULTISPECIES: hypothetical protein [Streptomyces]MCM3266050.1 hypothetical protein [Streptomyces thermoviolaceus]NJP16257.1 hypothetical protein [Streptomyces thermoviolaceus subsp. thermoviolaceus]RSS08191.1 hypothetical protein EF917_02805 [Streptomyces sp. WAC00469]WTD50523.1 hypothetical protein OG899_25220 [Streptomyces thermoviolaceus]GGV82601.1 hypothetical protein GCM10010499_48620 [Streptomyces thermoviolaceus subsp. apingens]